MWSRAELKENAKAVLRHSYWEGVVAYLIIGAISLGVSFIASLLSFVVPFTGVIATLFVMLPLSVGLNYFYMQNQVAPPVIGNVFFPFKGGRYMKITGAMAWMYLFSVLWSMISLIGVFIVIAKALSAMLPLLMDSALYSDWPYMGGSWLYDNSWAAEYLRTFDSSWITPLVVSGIILIAGSILACIKALSYSMTPYILTDNPYIGYERALKLSMTMTDGHKWRIFVLYLSFIGWVLLAFLTLGFGFLFLAPYIEATRAALYVKLRDNAINKGLTSPEEMNVFPQQ
jgi:uncharacterized membrane protein